MQDLIVSLVQAHIVAGQPQKNLKAFGEKLDALTGHTDIIFLPELFNTGFPVDPHLYAESLSGPTMKWLQDQAAKKQSVLVASLVVAEQNRFYNSLIWMQPDGTYHKYAKRHVFQLGEESEIISPGQDRIIIDYKDWKFCPQICYDLRFPVWSKNRYTDGKYEYDILFYVANWPHMRSHHWIQLLIARAIENQAYVIGVNRVGKDKNLIDHTGDSMVISPEGKVLFQARPREETVHTLKLSCQTMSDFREQFKVALDWDDYELRR